jgi:hypothetical protein
MKTKFGAIIVDGRGKIGGHVASKNRGGSYLRTKVTPANARTSAQLAVRNFFTQLSQAWRSLTQEQRDAWNAAVTDYSRTDIFGDLRNPSGINLFQRLNNNLLQIEEAVINEPPLPVEVANVVIDGLTAAVGTPAMSITLTDSVPNDTTLVVLATAPMSAGKSFVKSEFRRIGSFAAGSTSPQSILSEYVAKFGSTGAIGQKIFVKVFTVSTVTGQTGSASQVSVITTA